MARHKWFTTTQGYAANSKIHANVILDNSTDSSDVPLIEKKDRTDKFKEDIMETINRFFSQGSSSK